MQITAIVKQKNGSYDVYVDGEKVEKLDAVVLASKRNIKVGLEITEEELRDIKESSGANFAFDSAIKYISRTMRTESEVRSKLIGCGYSEEDAENAITRLKEYGYVNDQAYAKAYVSTYGRNRGSIRLSFELANKGIPKDVIEDALPEDDYLSAKILGENKLYKYKEREKMIRFLLSRGYDYELSKRVASELIEENKND